MYNTNKDYTVVAKEDCFMWTMEKEILKKNIRIYNTYSI